MSGIRHHILSVSVFIVLAALDFMPMHFHGWMILPLLWLSMCALSRRQYVLATALFFSFLGDVMGWKRELIPQIGFFALAQVTYIILFSLLKPPSATWPKPVRVGFLLLLAGIYGTATCWIFPRVTDSIVMGGMAVYALLLLAMCYAAFWWFQTSSLASTCSSATYLTPSSASWFPTIWGSCCFMSVPNVSIEQSQSSINSFAKYQAAYAHHSTAVPDGNEVVMTHAPGAFSPLSIDHRG